jgi:hypothetical protein
VDEFDPLLVALVNQKARQLVAAHREGVPLSYDDIGFVLGVTQSQARWDYRNGMRKIKKACKRFGITVEDLAHAMGVPASNFASFELWGEAS